MAPLSEKLVRTCRKWCEHTGNGMLVRDDAIRSQTRPGRESCRRRSERGLTPGNAAADTTAAALKESKTQRPRRAVRGGPKCPATIATRCRGAHKRVIARAHTEELLPPRSSHRPWYFMYNGSSTGLGAHHRTRTILKWFKSVRRALLKSRSALLRPLERMEV